MSREIPQLTLAGPTVQQVKFTDDVLIGVVASISRCGNGTNEELGYRYLWEQVYIFKPMI